MKLSDKHVAKILSLRHKLLQALIGIVTEVWGRVPFGIFSLVVYFLYILKQAINSCVSAAFTDSTEISWSQLSDLTNRRHFLFLRKASLLSSCMCRVRLLEGDCCIFFSSEKNEWLLRREEFMTIIVTSIQFVLCSLIIRTTGSFICSQMVWNVRLLSTTQVSKRFLLWA